MKRIERDGRQLVALRDDGECVRCHRGGEANWHHRKLRSKGGSWSPANGVSLCGSGTTGCHGHVHAHPAEARQHGFIVPSWADPAEVPVLLWRRIDGMIMRRTWALLTDDGDLTWIGPREAQERMERYGMRAAGVA